MQLQEEQLKDSVTKNLMEWMKHGPPERKHIVKECPALRHYWLCFQQLSMRDGVVYYKWKTIDGEKELFIVPESLKKEVLEVCHKSVLAAHPGIHRTVEKKCHEFARKSLKKSSEHQKRLHDLRKHEHTFETGDLVYAMDTARKIGKSPKLQAQWKGPYVVSKRLDKVLYEICNQKTTTVLHHDRLKPAMLDSVPLWITRQRRKLKSIEAEVLNIPEVETCLPEILEAEDPDSGGTVNENDRQSQELVAEISDEYDAFTDDEPDSLGKENSGLEDQTIISVDQTIQSLDSGVNITENTIKDSTIPDTETEQKELLSLDSGTLSPVSSGGKTNVNVTKKTESLNDALNPKMSNKTDDSSDSSESRTQAPDSHGNHQMTKEEHPPKISRYGRKINQPLRFKDGQ
ncbi:unnamed protein product [Mytilus edulis]|uniref:Integrase zinc-binding domain-containing protein n=1 Tax=Mytilus edulis TaxID=6550 RepID=A0A8S3VA03_MYTED|nr:unnamed protein product [Mytilus edulis]